MEVTPELAMAFMGAAEVDKNGAVILSDTAEHDPGTRTILFTDIVNSTSMTQHLGDDVAFVILQLHNRIVRSALAGANGREVKHTGDGIMAVFHSAAAAVRCAMNVQRDIAMHRDENPHEPLQVRIGMAAGEPVEHENDLFGSTVQLAARLCAHAMPEEIMMSSAVADLCIGKALPLEEAAPVSLKGFDKPIHVHCIKPLKKTA
jgi:class 3 adenylate cyclase